MKPFPITSKSLFKGTVVLLGIPAVLLLAIPALIVFMVFGGGWAYGTTGCRFVLNHFGSTMIAAVGLGVVTVLYAVGRRIARRLQDRRTRVDP